MGKLWTFLFIFGLFKHINCAYLLDWNTGWRRWGRRNKECKGGQKKVSVLCFIIFIMGYMWTQQNGTKSWRGEAGDAAMPWATKAVTLSAECRTTTTIVSLQYRWDQAARCQRVTGSLSVSVSLPTWTIVAERVQLLTALFIVRQQQCLTYYVHFNQRGTGSYFLCWCWSDKCLPTHVSVCLYMCPWFRSEAACDEHSLPFTRAIVAWTSAATEIAP